MSIHDYWEDDVHPARELTSYFRPCTAPVKAWKTGGIVKDIILFRYSAAEAALQEIDALAKTVGAKKICCSHFSGYKFSFDEEDPLPDGWFKKVRNDGITEFVPPRDVQKKLESAIGVVRNATNIRNVSLLLTYNRHMGSFASSSSIEFNSQLLAQLSDSTVKSIERMNGEFYITTQYPVRDVFGCEEIKLSEYHRMKENLAAAPKQTNQQKLEP